MRDFSENFEKWLRVLETTDLPQADGYLYGPVFSGDPDDPDAVTGTGYCCLGIACKLTPEAEIYITEPQVEQLMPIEAVRWLGLEHLVPPRREPWNSGPDTRRFDIWLDTDFRTRTGVGSSNVSAANLNDWGCTFPQIAQMIRYFGIQKVRI